MSVIHEEKSQPIDARLLIFPVVLAVAFFVLFFRLWYIQVAEAPALREKAESIRSQAMPTVAPRGVIVDRNNVLLAGVRSELVLNAQPRLVYKNKAAIHTISGIVGIPAKELAENITKERWRGFLPVPIARGLTIEAATRIAEAGDSFPGFTVGSQPMRVYSDPMASSHILGYVSTPSEKDVDRLKKLGVEPAVLVGKIGAERSHERELMGRPGSEEMELDPRGKPVRVVTTEQSVPGDKLILGLDAGLQAAALRELAGRKGSVVALEPTTGDVLCLASSPSYDSSQFLGGISTEDYNALLHNPDRPLTNRAIADQFAPGSTFKLVTALADYLAGKFSTTRTVFCGGYYDLGAYKPKCLGHHGAIAYHQAFTRSCNVYFMTLAREAGPDNLRKACAMLGLGSRTGIDLFGEVTGTVPTREWTAKHMLDGKWYPGNTVQFGIGQGFIATTPIQMANVMATVANGGVRYRPKLVRAHIPFGSKSPIPVKPTIEKRIEAPASFWNTLKAACLNVVEAGTARGSRIPGLAFGGKTGSAENAHSHLTHSWFIAFAPIDKPKIALAVLVENAGHGSDVAAPIASRLVKYYMQDRFKKKPQRPDNSVAERSKLAASSAAPATR